MATIDGSGWGKLVLEIAAYDLHATRIVSSATRTSHRTCRTKAAIRVGFLSLIHQWNRCDDNSDAQDALSRLSE